MVNIDQDFILIRSWNKIVLSASAFYPKTRKIAYFNIPCELKTQGHKEKHETPTNVDTWESELDILTPSSHQEMTAGGLEP